MQLHLGPSWKIVHSNIPSLPLRISYRSLSAICHLHKECHRAPTQFLIDAELFDVLDKSKRFDDLIKSKIPAPRCLLQLIDGSLKLAHLTSIPWINETLRLHHIQLFLNVAIKECSFHVHLTYLVIMICSYC